MSDLGARRLPKELAREADAEWRRIVAGANAAHELGLEVHAGHGLDYSTAATISGLPQIVELNIGHYLDGRGDLRRAWRERAPHAREHGRSPRQVAAKRHGGGDERWGMMILGLGNDIIDIRRVERTIERYGDRFLSRVFTDIERMKSDGRAMRAASYAKRFAAKEACAKALGTGFRHGVFWRDMGVVNLPSGRPTLELTGGALKALVDLTPEGHDVRIDLTITDDFPMAQAIVIISAFRIPMRD